MFYTHKCLRVNKQHHAYSSTSSRIIFHYLTVAAQITGAINFKASVLEGLSRDIKRGILF